VTKKIKKIRLLLIDDNPDDRTLVIRELVDPSDITKGMIFTAMNITERKKSNKETGRE